MNIHFPPELPIPPLLLNMIANNATPLLVAINILDIRISWVGTPKNKGSKYNPPTCWALDGSRATELEIIIAAGMKNTRRIMKND